MRRDHRRPFDLETNEAADVTQEFWGTTRGWAPVADDNDDQIVDDRTPRSLQSLKSSISGMRRRPWQPVRRTDASGRVDRTRSHGIPRPVTDEELEAIRREATLGELAAGWIDDDEWPELALALTRPHPTVAPKRHHHDRVQDTFDDEDEFDVYRDVYPEDDDDEVVPLSPVAPLASKLGLGAVDPLLARLGAIVVAGVLLLPLAMSARGGSHDVLADAGETVPTTPVAESVAATLAPVVVQTNAVAATQAAAVSTVAAPAPADAAPAATARAVIPAPTQSSAPAAVDSQPQSVVATTVPAADVAQSVSAATSPPAEVATVSVPAVRLTPDCSLSYEAGQGDSWFRIADAAGVTPHALMDQNLAGLDTPIFPGDKICLPEGATVPAKPVVTTAPPATTTPPTTAPPTTAKPTTTTTAKPTTTTTVKPTTTTAAPTPPPAPVSTADVQALIREIWPDELEERALQIAWRESNYKASAFNGSCCYGVFQINWASHKSWLGGYGITSANDLLDARKNITAAYALYQSSGGWGPWGG